MFDKTFGEHFVTHNSTIERSLCRSFLRGCFLRRSFLRGSLRGGSLRGGSLRRSSLRSGVVLPLDVGTESFERGLDADEGFFGAGVAAPEGSVHGEPTNFTRLVLGRKEGRITESSSKTKTKVSGVVHIVLGCIDADLRMLFQSCP